MTEATTSHIASASGELLTGRLHELISEAKAGDPLERVTVVTPGYFSSFYLRRRLANKGLLNVEFTRIEDLAETLARERIDREDGRPLTRLEGAELVRAAIAGTARTGVFANHSAHPAFLAAAQRTLRELEAAQGSNPVLFGRLASPDEITRAVGRIWNEYQVLKSEQKLFDRTQVAGWASKAIENGALDASDMRLSTGRLVVIAAAIPAPQYRPLWQVLVKSPGVRTLVLMTGDRSSDEALVKSFALEDRLDFDAAEVSPPPPPQIVSATDTRSEVAALVQRIAADAECGIPLNHIAVLSGDPAYSARIRSALELAEIPVAGPPGGALIESPAGRFVRGLLGIASSGMERRQVGDWLATCPVQEPETMKPVTGTDWDRISRSARVTSGADRWESQLRHFADARQKRAGQIERRGDDSSSSGGGVAADGLRAEAKSAERLRSFISGLARELEPPEGQMKWSEWSAWLLGLLGRYLHVTEGSTTAETAERTKALLERITQLDSMPSAEPDLDRFAAVVVRELSETPSGQAKLGRGVFVGEIRDAAGTRFERVHIPGMADGTFPSPDTADPLLPDYVREELNRVCGIDLPVSGVRQDLRRREFLTALSSGSRATLYWSRSNGTGSGEAGPAQWLVEQARRRPGGEQLQASELLDRDQLPGFVALADYASGDAASDIHEYEVASVRLHVERQAEGGHWLERDARSGVPVALELERRRYGEGFSPWSGDLSSVAGKVPSASGAVLSASRVESFASCPMRYFFSYVLQVDPGVREDDSFHMPADRRGTLIHSILEAYLNLRIRHGMPQGETTLITAMDRAVAEFRSSDPGASGRVLDLEIAEMRRQLRRWLAKEAELEAEGFSPVDAELSFGRSTGADAGPELDAFEIKLSDGETLQFSGVIDRVEQHRDGSYYVIDYKSGKPDGYSKMRGDPVDRGRRLQLALYSRAVEQLWSTDSKVTAGYWFVIDPKQRFVPERDEFDPDEAGSRLHTVLESLQTSSAAGHFPPNPGDPVFGARGSSFENCQYCDFDSVCPSNSRRQRMRDSHYEENRLASYFDLALGRERGGE